ncbi:MAG: hypothetical protein BSOLF_0948 [Candidatus Carbobacillus altaicus]|uniref:Uncharacterized protein n=1 Tax=Candidatus Carbonibacillus altaicus TaxID=2163959 RepID=A0A2R6Y526_9BACL|nr:MAG: hypothetical protein BSOLF_0948 [Candidatus Carbobacillus altaicus]
MLQYNRSTMIDDEQTLSVKENVQPDNAQKLDRRRIPVYEKG